jgi:NAD(P)-dependent dehydrogenase (short-subunit alcohol dehydrogenase family)
MTSMQGQRIVMSGGSRGIGQGVARLLCAEGATVVSLDQRPGDETAGLAGAGFHTVEADVSEPGDVERAFAAADDLLGGPLHGLVCVAGIAPEVSFLETTPDVLDRVLAVNVRGPFLCGQAAARRMAESGGGRIVNIASTASVQAWSLQTAYGASKGAVALLTKNMAVELAPLGIAVNAIGPGTIDTPLAVNMTGNQAWADHDLSRTPAGRWGTPDDIAVAVRFLLRDAEWLTGQVLYVDGGFLATGGPMLDSLGGHVSIER